MAGSTKVSITQEDINHSIDSKMTESYLKEYLQEVSLDLNSSPSFSWPLKGKLVLYQDFGTKYAKFYPNSKGHWAIDISAGYGAPVVATADGIIKVAEDNCSENPNPDCNYGGGNWVMLWHPQYGVHSIYQHLRKNLEIKVNDSVSKGQVIGYEGSSGRQFFLW